MLIAVYVYGRLCTGAMVDRKSASVHRLSVEHSADGASATRNGASATRNADTWGRLQKAGPSAPHEQVARVADDRGSPRVGQVGEQVVHCGHKEQAAHAHQQAVVLRPQGDTRRRPDACSHCDPHGPRPKRCLGRLSSKRNCWHSPIRGSASRGTTTGTTTRAVGKQPTGAGGRRAGRGGAGARERRSEWKKREGQMREAETGQCARGVVPVEAAWA